MANRIFLMRLRSLSNRSKGRLNLEKRNDWQNAEEKKRGSDSCPPRRPFVPVVSIDAITDSGPQKNLERKPKNENHQTKRAISYALEKRTLGSD